MMKKVFFGLLFIAFCVFAAPSGATAQVTVYTDLVHDNWSGANEMVGVAYTTSSYSSSYCVDIQNVLYRIEDGEEIDSASNLVLGDCNSQVWTETFLPYVEGADYTVEADVVANSNYEYEYYPGYYYDPYGYAYYNQLEEPMREIWWFGFASTSGAPTSPWGSFALGIVYSYLEAGASSRSGAPHHLKALSDVTTTDFQVVDSQKALLPGVGTRSPARLKGRCWTRKGGRFRRPRCSRWTPARGWARCR